MVDTKELIKKINEGSLSHEEQLNLLAQVEQTIKEQKQKKEETLQLKTDYIIQAFNKIKTDLETRIAEIEGKEPIKGDKGEKGDKGDRGLDGYQGRDGKDGKDGKDGLDGQDGVGVADARIDFDGTLVITLTNGKEITAGDVMPLDVADKLQVFYNNNAGGGGNSQTVLDAIEEIQAQLASGSFTQLAIPTATGQSTLIENTTITGWLYSGTSFSISAQEGTPSGLFFSPDGLKMYVNGSTGDDVNEYTLSSAWDISTASYVTVFSTASQDSAPADLFFSPDGLTMFVLGDTNNSVFQYTLGTPWSVATASYASKSFSVGTQETTPSGLWFKPDGTTMYIVGSTNDTVYQYTLGTAWDVSTAAYASKSYSVGSQEATPTQVNLSADGAKMWIAGQSGDDIWEYTLGTAWDVSTATPVNNFYVGFQETNPSGMFIDSSAANRAFMVGSTSDTVYKYNTEANSLEIDTEKLYVDGQLSVNGNLVAGSNAYVDGALTVQGAATFSSVSASSTLTATSTLSLTGSTAGSAAFATSVTTANTTINTGQTSGTFTLGGTSGTGTITLGRATTSQTTDIQAGATASGNTKAINIGTAGLSGSTTNINIGSAVSGATSTTTLSGLVVNSISAAVSAAGSTQGTATALVANINNVTVVAAAADGVRLPTAVAGMRILVRNSDSADTLKIYPATGGQINALGSNAAYSLTAGSTIELMATTATQWYTF